jgi:hypothetical protein
MKAHEFSVSVTTQYLDQQSDPVASRYVFAYTITIKNIGTVKAQLIARHWIIKDANDKEEQVRGLGVCMVRTCALPKRVSNLTLRFRNSYCHYPEHCISYSLSLGGFFPENIVHQTMNANNKNATAASANTNHIVFLHAKKIP